MSTFAGVDATGVWRLLTTVLTCFGFATIIAGPTIRSYVVEDGVGDKRFGETPGPASFYLVGTVFLWFVSSIAGFATGNVTIWRGAPRMDVLKSYELISARYVVCRAKPPRMSVFQAGTRIRTTLLTHFDCILLGGDFHSTRPCSH